MKRIALLLAGCFVMMAQLSIAQGIDDRAVIPVAVTLNSILRLNVTSGGSIEFNFNTLNDYEHGINNGGTSAAYQTKFNIASSVNWNVRMYAEDAVLVGTDITGGTDLSGTNQMTLNNIGYSIASGGAGTVMANYMVGPADEGVDHVHDLKNVATNLLIGYKASNSNAGDINKNSFIINWRCGTQEDDMRDESILEQNLASDRYATNVFLVLEPN